MSWFSKNRVLVPIDFSEAAFKALDEALTQVADPSCLHVVHVIPKLSPMEPGVVWETVTDESRIEKVEETFWQHYSAQADQMTGINLKVKIGNASSEILDYADENDIQLIVIPSHGRQGLDRFLMGSVAERVVRYAACPVLVLRRVSLDKIAQLEQSLKND